MKIFKAYCKCCGCLIQLEDAKDIKICEECTTCPEPHEGPCQVAGVLI